MLHPSHLFVFGVEAKGSFPSKCKISEMIKKS